MHPEWGRSCKSLSWPPSPDVPQTIAGPSIGQTHLEARRQGSPGSIIAGGQAPRPNTESIMKNRSDGAGVGAGREKWRIANRKQIIQES